MIRARRRDVCYEAPVASPDPVARSGPRWDLNGLFPALDDRRFRAAMEEVTAGIDRMVARYDELGIDADAPHLAPEEAAAHAASIIEATNALQSTIRPVTAYLHARITTDAFDDEAAAANGSLQTALVPLAALAPRWEGWLRTQEPGRFASLLPITDDHRHALDRAAAGAAHRMSAPEEHLAAELRPSGSAAWAKLHRDVTAGILVAADLPDGTVTLPMSAIRGLATHADADVRRRAYDAELAAWRAHEVPLAAALNGAIGERVVLNRRRGWGSDLDAALFANAVDRATLDAMHEAVGDALPHFRRYLRAKAAALGRPGRALPWPDLLAPVGAQGGRLPWDVAVARVRDAFAGYAPSLRDLADRAVSEAWIDAEARPGKVDGAYCLSVRPGESRVLMNFDGSTKSVQTLAHELGHAFHGLQLAERTPLQKATPMALAETASIFCETLLLDSLLRSVPADDPAARLAILDTDLQGATQIVVDIHSRFLFESALGQRRRARSLTPTELCDLMLDAQGTAYADGLDPEVRHPYMWAVKGHYFTPFYNWPYTFGLLFGLGLFARYRDDADRFRRGYDDLLSRTGMADAVALAAAFGIDLHQPTFWAASLEVIRARVDDYVALVEAPGGPGETAATAANLPRP